MTRVEKFSKDDRGGISFLIMPLFILLLFMSGLAIDLVQQETLRADLQNALDRGNLAAASLSQDEDAEALVTEYVNKRQFQYRGQTLSVNVFEEEQDNFRRITSSAAFDMNTAFARLAFQEQFLVPAVSEAFEGVEKVEISLALDISASMVAANTTGSTERRMEVLKQSAKTFVTDLLTGENRQKVSISLIPYAGGVNAGPFFEELLQGSAPEPTSRCVEFRDVDFTYTGLPPSNSRPQVPQFQYFYFEANAGNDAVWGWCPNSADGGLTPYSDKPIIPFSKDIVQLHDAIDAFQGHDGTGTDIAMKWALALLDPTTQPLIAGIPTVPEEFRDRPSRFGESGVLKIIVLMTDGGIRHQARPLPSELEDPIRREFWAKEGERVGEDTLNVMSLVWPSRGIDNPSLTTLPSVAQQDADENDREANFLALCDLAKTARVRVFTIGFDLASDPTAAGQMESCASRAGTENDFYNVEGTDLVSVFEQIATLVSALQLSR